MRFKKEHLSLTLVLVFALLIFMPTSIQASQVHVTIDGMQVVFTDQGPTIVDGRTLVPVRGVFEELGFEVDWEQDTQTARLTRSGYEVTLTIGSANFITNGENHTLDVPAQIIGGRTMLPIRAVLESVGYFVDWSQATNTVLISSSGGYATSENRNRFNLSDGINEKGFFEGVTALDYVEMFDYNNLGIPYYVHRMDPNLHELISEWLSEMTDEELLEYFFDFEVTTIEELKEEILKKLKEFLEWPIEDFIEDYIVYEVNVSSIPEKLRRYYIQKELGETLEEFAKSFEGYLEIYLEMFGFDSVDEFIDDIIDEFIDDAIEWEARRSLVLQAVAEHGGFSVSMEEVGDFFEVHSGSRDYSWYKEEYGLPYITKIVLQQKILDHIIENAVLL